MTTTADRQIIATNRTGHVTGSLLALAARIVARLDRRSADRPLSPFETALLTHQGMHLHSREGATGLVHSVQHTPGGYAVIATVADVTGQPFADVDHGANVRAAFPEAVSARPLGRNGYAWLLTYRPTATPFDGMPRMAVVRPQRRVWLAVLALAVAVAFGVAAGAVGLAYAQGARGFCPTEDSPSCVWVGPVAGQPGTPGYRTGRIVVNGPEDR